MSSINGEESYVEEVRITLQGFCGVVLPILAEHPQTSDVWPVVGPWLGGLEFKLMNLPVENSLRKALLPFVTRLLDGLNDKFGTEYGDI